MKEVILDGPSPIPGNLWAWWDGDFFDDREPREANKPPLVNVPVNPLAGLDEGEILTLLADYIPEGV